MWSGRRWRASHEEKLGHVVEQEEFHVVELVFHFVELVVDLVFHFLLGDFEVLKVILQGVNVLVERVDVNVLAHLR